MLDLTTNMEVCKATALAQGFAPGTDKRTVLTLQRVPGRSPLGQVLPGCALPSTSHFRLALEVVQGLGWVPLLQPPFPKPLLLTVPAKDEGLQRFDAADIAICILQCQPARFLLSSAKKRDCGTVPVAVQIVQPSFRAILRHSTSSHFLRFCLHVSDEGSLCSTDRRDFGM